MLDRLIDLIIEFMGLFQCFVFVDEFDEAVVLRAGRYNRTIGPGFHWILPLNIEDLIDVNVKPTHVYTSNQSLHTKDDYLVNIQCGFVLRVRNPLAYLVEFEDTEAQIVMLVEGNIAEAVSKYTFKEVHNGTFLTGIKRKARKLSILRGAALTNLVVVDLANGDANKLWVEGVEL